MNRKNMKFYIVICLCASFILIGLQNSPVSNAQTTFQLIQSPANNHCNGQTVSSYVFHMGSTPTSGNMMILTMGLVGIPGFTTITGLTESGVTWTKVCNSSQNGGSDHTSFNNEIWAGIVGNGASRDISITLSNSHSDWVLLVSEWKGIRLTNPVDQTAINQYCVPPGSSYPNTGTTATTQYSNELCIGSTFLTYYSQSNPSDDYSMVLANDNNHDSLAYLYKTVTTKGQQSCTTTGSGVDYWFGCMATFVSTDYTSPTPTPTPWSNATITPTPTIYPTATPSPTPNRIPTPTPPSNHNIDSPTITLSCQSTTSSSGFRVQINGRIAVNGVAMPNARILISYSNSGGTSWQSLTSVVTGSDGNFSAEWLPTASGNYFIMAFYGGDLSRASAFSIVNINVSPSSSQSAQTLFSVASNSTVTDLVFDSNRGQLSFTVNGTSHTVGYVDVYIAKSLIHDISLVKVYVDGNSVNFGTTSNGDSWILHFVYSHSTHAVTLSLNQNETSNIDFTSVGVIIVAMIAAGLIIFVLRRRH